MLLSRVAPEEIKNNVNITDNIGKIQPYFLFFFIDKNEKYEIIEKTVKIKSANPAQIRKNDKVVIKITPPIKNKYY